MMPPNRCPVCLRASPWRGVLVAALFSFALGTLLYWVWFDFRVQVRLDAQERRINQAILDGVRIERGRK